MKEISVDVVVAINQYSLRKSASKAQVFKIVEVSIDFIRGSKKTGHLTSFILFLYSFRSI